MAKLENPTRLFPMVISTKLSETKAFYLQLGFKTRFDMPNQYLQMFTGSGDGLDLCFMAPHQATNGKDYPEFGGSGLLVSIPTADADKKCAELKALGIKIDSELEDKPWGWRSFHVTDPNGVILDLFHVYKAGPPADEQS